MTCSDCSGEDYDRCVETKSLDGDTEYNTEYWFPPSHCNGDYISSSCELALDTSAPDDANDPYDTISGASKAWYLKSHFDDLPSNLLDESSCDHSSYSDDELEPNCDYVEYLVEQDESESNERDNYDFKNPVPDGDSNDDDGYTDEVVGLLISVAAASTGNPYVSAGAGFIKNFIGGGSDGITVTKGFIDSDRQTHRQLQWEINMNGQGHDSFPTAPCDSTGVKFDIQDNSGAGTSHTTHTYSRYDIQYPSYMDDCRCDWYGWSVMIKTSDYVENTCNWTSG